MEENIVKPVDKTYAQLWMETSPLEIPGMGYQYGTKGLTKMMQFTKGYALNNRLIDELMSLSPMEEENILIKGEEGAPDVILNMKKITSKFQKELLKFRHRIYEFSALRQKDIKRIEKLKTKTNEDRQSIQKNRKERRTTLQPVS